jgi:hypothetical protein
MVSLNIPELRRILKMRLLGFKSSPVFDCVILLDRLCAGFNWCLVPVARFLVARRLFLIVVVVGWDV